MEHDYQKEKNDELPKTEQQSGHFTATDLDQAEACLTEFLNHCKERNIDREKAGQIFFEAYDEFAARHEDRCVAYARKVFKNIANLEVQEYDRRCAKFAKVNTQMAVSDKDTYDLINTARAAGRFSNHPPGPQLTYVHPDYPPAFRLSADGMVFGEAVRFFEYWKRSHPTALPTNESRLACMADIEEMLRPAVDFAREEFIEEVMKSFALWKWGY